MLQAQLHGRSDEVLQISEKTAEVRANGFRVRRLADDLSFCGAAESIQKLSKQKAYVAFHTLDISVAYILFLHLPDGFLQKQNHSLQETTLRSLCWSRAVSAYLPSVSA